MAQKIFKSIFLTSLIIMVLCLTLILGINNKYFSGQYEASLENEAKCISSAVEAMGEDYFNGFNSSQRVTWIAGDGSVIYDSKNSNVEAMDNHADREEFKEAVQTGTGKSIRYSDTMAQKTINVAVRLEDGSVLRVSDTQRSFLSIGGSMLYPALFIVLLTVVISLVISSRVAAAIVRPINEINLDKPEEKKVYKELQPLVRRIRSQNRQIRLQIARIEQEHEKNDRLRREFTANVSHELRTPLTSISGFAEIIREGIAKPQDVKNFAGKIYNEAQRLVSLVGDIIELSHLEETGSGEKRERVDLYEICQSVAERIKAAAELNNISISLSGHRSVIYGNRKIIEEMAYNLCDNAVKYNKPGGSIAIEATDSEDGVVLRVSDTGIGIPEKDRDRVFERFYRVDKSHSREIGGTGLGLSIVKHGALYHNAKISMESELGKGTRIAIVFPKSHDLKE